jgi:uncharacterized protein (DUF58 family)
MWEALAFILVAMILLDTVFLCIALVYLVFLLFALAIEQPKGAHLDREKLEIKAMVDDVVDIANRVSVDSGVGIVTIADKLPTYFELNQDGGDPSNDSETIGGNFRVYWKGTSKISTEMRYRVKLTKRGIYEIPPPAFELFQVANLKQAYICSSGTSMTMSVRNRPINVKRMRSPRLISHMPIPLGAITNIGVHTDEFRELRQYVQGDPYNKINWKATARLCSFRPNMPPLVNEYEREGRQTVWILLDASSRMRRGTEIENAFEYGVRAVSGLSQFYLARNCRVALSIYNCGTTLLPDTGRRQEYRIAKALLKAEVNNQRQSLGYAIDNHKWHLVGQNPLFIIVTMVGMDNINELLEGIRKMRLYSIANRSQVIVIDILGYDIVARGISEEIGAQLLDYTSLPARRALRRGGAFVASWDGKREILERMMVLGAKRR